jgi:CRP-like cAMP-binding protein
MTTPTFDSARRVLQNAALLQGLSEYDLQLALSGASVRAVPKGAFVFNQGEPARELFLLESGRVRLQETTAEGRDLLVRFVLPGDVFGDQAAIPDAKYSAFALSETACRVRSWSNVKMAALMERAPRLAFNLFAITTRYLHYSRERYRLLATAPVERRIDWALAELARSIGFSEGRATVIAGRALQKDIADLASTTIYTVSRVLSGYARRGILSRKRGRILLYPRTGALAG